MTTGLETVGIFRRAAGKSRVEVLKGLMETNPGEEAGAYPHGGKEEGYVSWFLPACVLIHKCT